MYTVCIYVDGLRIISTKKLIMENRDFVQFTVRWRHRLDRLRKQALHVCCGDADNLEVLAIVLIMKKRFLQAEEVFRRLTLSSRHLLV